MSRNMSHSLVNHAIAAIGSGVAIAILLTAAWLANVELFVAMAVVVVAFAVFSACRGTARGVNFNAATGVSLIILSVFIFLWIQGGSSAFVFRTGYILAVMLAIHSARLLGMQIRSAVVRKDEPACDELS